VARDEVERAVIVRLHGKELPRTRLCRVKDAVSSSTHLKKAAVASRLDGHLVVTNTVQDHVLVHVAVVFLTASLLRAERVLQALASEERPQDDRHVERDIRQVHC